MHMQGLRRTKLYPHRPRSIVLKGFELAGEEEESKSNPAFNPIFAQMTDSVYKATYGLPYESNPD